MENTYLEKLKSKYIDGEILTLTINGGLGRGNKIYKKVDDVSKEKFRLFIRKKLKDYSKLYEKPVSSRDHTKNIKKFGEVVSTKYGDILLGGKLRFGRSQKLMNLYLKYLWVLGLMCTQPPHCPFDSLIIEKMGNEVSDLKWTSMEDVDDYLKLVEAAKKAKNTKESIAEWELRIWNDINGKEY